MIKKTLLIAVVGLAATIVNPFFACDALQPEFHYDAVDMRIAIEGTWRLQLPARGATPARQITFSIAQGSEPEQHAQRAGLVRAANACSHRSFVRSAEACGDISDMPLDVRVGDVKSSGRLLVIGTEFRVGSFELDGLKVIGQVAPNGTITKVSSGAGELSPTAMVRVSQYAETRRACGRPTGHAVGATGSE